MGVPEPLRYDVCWKVFRSWGRSLKGRVWLYSLPFPLFTSQPWGDQFHPVIVFYDVMHPTDTKHHDWMILEKMDLFFLRIYYLSNRSPTVTRDCILFLYSHFDIFWRASGTFFWFSFHPTALCQEERGRKQYSYVTDVTSQLPLHCRVSIFPLFAKCRHLKNIQLFCDD